MLQHGEMMFEKIKQAAFFTKCKIASVNYGLAESSAEKLVEFGYEILADCREKGLKPEAALAVLCMMVIQSKPQVPNNILDAADLFARTFIYRYPHEALAKNLSEIIIG